MEYNTKKWRGVAALLLLAFVLYCVAENLGATAAALGNFIGLFAPLVMGCVLAFLLNLPMSFLERHLWQNTSNPRLQKLRRPVSLLGAFVFICAVVSAVVALVLPELARTIQLLMDQVPRFYEQMLLWVNENADMFPVMEQWLRSLSIDWQQLGKNLLDALGSGAVGVVGGTVSIVLAIFNGVINFVIALIFAVYILVGKEKLGDQFHRTMRAYLPQKAERVILHVAHVAYGRFASFVTGQCTEAVILGCLCALGMTLLRLPYAAMVGAMVGATALIPVVGAFLGGAVGAFMIMMVNPLQAVGFVVFLVILQQLENNLIYPRVVGASVGLPALWVLAAITVGGGINGVAGMLLSVPLASTLYILLRENVQYRNAMLDAKVQVQEKREELRRD